MIDNEQDVTELVDGLQDEEERAIILNEVQSYLIEDSPLEPLPAWKKQFRLEMRKHVPLPEEKVTVWVKAEKWWLAQPYHGIIIAFCGWTLLALTGLAGMIITLRVTNLAWYEMWFFFLIDCFALFRAINALMIYHGYIPQPRHVVVEHCEHCENNATTEQVFEATQPEDVPDHVAYFRKHGMWPPRELSERGKVFFGQLTDFLREIVNTGECGQTYWTNREGFGRGAWNEFMPYLLDAKIVKKGEAKTSPYTLTVPLGNYNYAMRLLSLAVEFDVELSLNPTRVNGQPLTGYAD